MGPRKKNAIVAMTNGLCLKANADNLNESSMYGINLMARRMEMLADFTSKEFP